MKGKGLFQPLVSGTVLAIGFLAGWMFLGVVFVEDGGMLLISDMVFDSLGIQADGTALIAHHEEGETSYRDLEGNVVRLSEDDPVDALTTTRLPADLPSRPDDGDWDSRVRFFTDGRRPHTAWYFIADGRSDGTAYFVGYDSYTKAKIGYLGASGFRVDFPPPEDRFPFVGATTGERLQEVSPGQGVRGRRASANRERLLLDGTDTVAPRVVYVLGRDDRIYEADLRKRTVRIAVADRDVRSFSLIDIQQGSPAHYDWRLAVRTDTDVLVLDKHGTEQQRYPIPPELRERPFIFGDTTAREAMMYWNKEHTLIDTEDEYRLYWVQPDGRFRTAALTLPGRPVPGLKYLLAAVLPSPGALALAGMERSRELMKESLEPTLSAALLRTIREFWSTWFLAQLLALTLTVLCYRRQVRYGTSRSERILWPLFVLLVGLPGWIGYRFGRSWPVLETCPDCGIAVPRDRPSCLTCTLDFPRPTRMGTEVFA